MLNIIKHPDRKDWSKILQRPVFDVTSLEAIVAPIIEEIQTRGDEAIREYTKMFDNVDVADTKVSLSEIVESEIHVTPELKRAIDVACRNIEKFHAIQKREIVSTETSTGVLCWQKAVAIEKVGFYIPGGTAPLFSTVLMLAIPARIAGCREMVLCTPPDKEGNMRPEILYAAKVTGITQVFKVGGVQAIAAMAYGTQTIPNVYKIFGPGNQYVTCAKQLVSRGNVAIDMPAGPSEVAVIADDMAIPAFVASDLLSQAEHGNDSQVVLVTRYESLIAEVMQELQLQIEQLPRKKYAERSLKHSKVILLHDDFEIIDLINEYAPEHLIISTRSCEEMADKIINAGSVFLGNYTPESAGDYASGTNHTLPTNGFAKIYSGVNLDSFMKKITFQKLTNHGLQLLGPDIELMARAEQLDAHANAVRIRLNSLL